MSNKDQQQLFDNPPAWTEHWQGMPEFEQKEELPFDSINVQFKTAESLRDQHPDIVKITQKWNRWQHHVDYFGFKKNKLIPIAGGDHANAS